MEEIKLQIPSPIDTINIDGISFFVKRDDLIDKNFSGNKARKFYYFLTHDFSHIRKLISYGSNQSNAMYSMSILARLKGWDFEYYTNHLSEFLRDNPHGNYKGAIDNGMNIFCHPDGIYTAFKQKDNDSILFIQEGGREKEASYGIEIMAKEIIDWQILNNIQELNIFLPSGTGTTALFLQKHCSIISKKHSIVTKVYTTPCVGDSDYLLNQFKTLEPNKKYYPTIIKPKKKYHFGKLYKELYIIWLKLRKQTGIEFDLLYDPIGWSVLMDNLNIFSTNTLYIHQGGLLGNISMNERYKRKYKDL